MAKLLIVSDNAYVTKDLKEEFSIEGWFSDCIDISKTIKREPAAVTKNDCFPPTAACL